jgi:MtN3 and saliva related transmembrane protein
MGEIFGIMAAITTTASFFPQVLKAWRSHSLKDVSLGMYVLISAGLFLWIVYGVQIRSYPIILANSLTLVQALLILAAKLRFRPHG